MAQVESAWLELRTLHDQLRVTRSLGATISPRGVTLDSLLAQATRTKALVQRLVAQLPRAGRSPEDSAALAYLTRELASIRPERGNRRSVASAEPDCTAPSPEALRAARRDSLTAHTFECYGAAARRIVVDGDTLDRLSILGRLGSTDDPSRRRRLFMALEPIWRSVNGDDADASPYRAMVRLRVASWRPDSSPMQQRARSLGIAPDTLEHWLVQVLEAFRATMPDTLLEPWDFYYLTDEAGRLLSGGIPRDSLRPLSERYYRSLGADLPKLGVHFDLDPRPGKYPVSFTDFGARNPVEPWIFTSYRIGGLGNLEELLHEEGHAIHIAAIRTRGAYSDWPDSDTFTEAIADVAALEVYEPEWQRRFLAKEVPLASSIRDKYAGIVLDVAWTLFEIRVHRSPERSPNQIWTEITRDYLRIRPHPELSWWAMRGQLVNSPGYILNYAFGAILIADIRARLIAEHGSFATGDSRWYSWISSRLYRFGAERPARQVVQDFLGRPVRLDALLADLERAKSR